MAPISATMAAFLAVPAIAGPCLCVFDTDRTLTGSQGVLDQCPNNLGTNINDHAYDGGTLTLSEAAHQLENTFCAQCYMGIVSAGDAGGPGSEEQTELHKRLSVGMADLPDHWHYGCNSVDSPLVVTCTDGLKQNAVQGIQAWYHTQGVAIADEDIHMFDDRVSNIGPFKNTNYNARQISCATRDSKFNNEIGFCGASLGEVVADKGVYLCGDSPAPASTPAPAPTPPPAPDPAPSGSCSVGDSVSCPPGEGNCAGNQCCQDGSTCPSAEATYSCQFPKAFDCTQASVVV